MPQSTDSRLESWHLDKRVPVALIIAILMQTGGAVWWVATTRSRVENIERRTLALEISGGKMADALAQSMQLLSSINATQAAMRDSLTRMERQIDRQAPRPNQ